MQTISVRRRSVPLKQAAYEVPVFISFSSSVVCSIMATVLSTLKSGSPCFEVSMSSDRLASSNRPCRTSHQGDSGAIKQPIRIGIGQIHCRAYGMRQPQLEVPSLTIPRRTPEADELSHNPAEVDVGGEVGPEGDWHDFRSVGGGDGLENSPRKTAKDLADQEHREVLGKEQKEQKTGDRDESAGNCFLVAEMILENTGGEQAEDFTNAGAVSESRSPFRRNDRLALIVELIVELRDEG